MGFGGKGANQAVMAAKLGGHVTMLTKLGDDVLGRDYLDNFRALGLDTAHVLVTGEASTGVAPIWVDEATGDNQIIVVLGANELLTVDEVHAARDAIASCAVLLCQWECPLPVVSAALDLAHNRGLMTIFNPAPARGELPGDIYPKCDFVCPNESEAEALTGLPVSTIDDAAAAGRVLLDRGARNAVITLGERGALWVGPRGAVHVPAPRVRAVDTTGAGDAFLGTFAYFCALGLDPVEAITRANRVASISVQRPGTQASFPSRDEVGFDL